ncbi:hypothetical protein ACQPXH_20805 [Nocardia sp. CA-135953]|uniref:hypothetical protein n=1 Tax=Nocardia sp. CA-135953 TaxID=3239978 RepID=UPI003D994A0A
MSARSDADIAAIRMMMDRLDLTVADISDDTPPATNVPTFGDYIPVVADSMPASRTRDHYRPRSLPSRGGPNGH